MLEQNLSEKFTDNIFNNYQKNEDQQFLDDNHISEFIKDVNRSINRFYEPTELDIQIFKNLYDYDQDGKISKEDFQQALQNFLP